MSKYCDNCAEEPFFGMDECEGCGEERGCELCYTNHLCFECVAAGIR